MIYELTFLETAKKEWAKLAPDIQKQFKTKLLERLINPRIPKDKLTSMPDCYKVKLRTVGYRLVYKVIDSRLVVQVIAVGRRDQNTIYKLAHKRLL
ncbi:type II toxin-antitoxin system RelE family toxin [Rickettsia endosymbiont of Orchestes rusci]|uniref:type II toxin-antitoxin system RelE family toxin n=1 Tax=Rickettsia endosymbiont of Orchestes rusci TaxID=3066250 RepID=UPI00313D15B4